MRKQSSLTWAALCKFLLMNKILSLAGYFTYKRVGWREKEISCLNKKGNKNKKGLWWKESTRNWEKGEQSADDYQSRKTIKINRKRERSTHTDKMFQCYSCLYIYIYLFLTHTHFTFLPLTSVHPSSMNKRNSAIVSSTPPLLFKPANVNTILIGSDIKRIDILTAASWSFGVLWKAA